MSYDYRIHGFYEEIYEELHRVSTDSERNKRLLNEHFELTEEFNNLMLQDVHPNKSILEIADIIRERLYEFIEKYFYKLYYNYAVSKLKEIDIFQVKRLEDKIHLWTAYSIDHLATEINDNGVLKEILPIDLYNDETKERINDLVEFCSLEFPEFSEKTFAKIFEKSRSYMKNKLMKMFHSKNKNKLDEDKRKRVENILDILINEIQELYNKVGYNISFRDIKSIIEYLFKQHKIFEIILYRLITRLGLPSVINVTYKEHEIDIVTLVDRIEKDGSGLRLIEVTTRRNYNEKLCRCNELLNKLHNDGITNIKIIVIVFNQPVNRNINNIHIISFYELIKNYPYKLISVLLNPESANT